MLSSCRFTCRYPALVKKRFSAFFDGVQLFAAFMIRLELLNDFRETAQGMMENIQEAQRSAEQRWAKVAEDIQRELDALHRE